VRSLWQRWRDPLHLHARLEARRTRARPEFVRQLTDELGARSRTARAPLRHAFAVALTLLMLVAAGILGGTGYAAHAAKKVSSAVPGISGGGERGLSVSNNSDDDDDGGGRGDDDDDDGGGGGGGGDDDDDDDPDDDQYEEDDEECELAVNQAHVQFHATGRGSHYSFHRWMRAALRECDDIGGDDDDDD
jgi:hypothetical protein